ncbi:MAG: glutamate racemase [Candidatus Cloacimonadota bacterium]|nr:MAG: glutamate racemase [Candidatus Cloacimonadota bacterium]
MDKKAIGIFDSGVGGLTVFKEIRKQFPNEDIIYFGDTARLPYGPKSRRTIIEYSLQNASFLVQQQVKIIIIACNTASSVALDILKQTLDIPVIGVIEPGSLAAVNASKNKKIGVIGTSGTIKSMAYEKEIRRLSSEVTIMSRACPLLVSLAEEGWLDHKATELIISEYLEDFKNIDIDTLVLGCTHYPILKKAVGKFFDNKINLIDSAEAISEVLKEILPEPEISGEGKDNFYVSDNEEKFINTANIILGKEISALNRVVLGKSWLVDSR